MGCGKTREVQNVNIENQLPGEESNNQNNLVDTLLEDEKESVGDANQHEHSAKSDSGNEARKNDKYSANFMKVEKMIPVNEEIGKIGEDHSAGVIDQGKAKEASLDLHLKKLAIPKKLPPLKNPPQASSVKTALPSSLSKFSKHEPDMTLIQTLLGNEKDQGFQDLNLDSVEAQGDASIKRIMQELSIDYH